MNYECPHCGAKDSTRCALLPPATEDPYPADKLAKAREAGCRVAYHIDLSAKHPGGIPPDQPDDYA